MLRNSFSLRLDPKYALDTLKVLLHFPYLLPKLFQEEDLLVSFDKMLQEAYRRDRTTLKHTYGIDIYLNPGDTDTSPRLGVLGWIEGGTTRLFFRLLRKDSTVIDVGANIGWFTLLAARIVGSNGMVLAFEPEETNFSLLSKSVAKNNFRNVRLLQQCVSNIDGMRSLHLASPRHPGHHSTTHDFGNGAIDAPSVRLDMVIPSLGVNQVDLLKVDVEGAEPEVLEGAESLLTLSRVKNIIMEWNPVAWVGREKLLDSLRHMYDFYQIADSKPFPLLRKVPTDMQRAKLQKNLFLRIKG